MALFYCDCWNLPGPVNYAPKFCFPKNAGVYTGALWRELHLFISLLSTFLFSVSSAHLTVTHTRPHKQTNSHGHVQTYGQFRVCRSPELNFIPPWEEMRAPGQTHRSACTAHAEHMQRPQLGGGVTLKAPAVRRISFCLHRNEHTL